MASARYGTWVHGDEESAAGHQGDHVAHEVQHPHLPHTGVTQIKVRSRLRDHPSPCAIVLITDALFPLSAYHTLSSPSVLFMPLLSIGAYSYLLRWCAGGQVLVLGVAVGGHRVLDDRVLDRLDLERCNNRHMMGVSIEGRREEREGGSYPLLCSLEPVGAFTLAMDLSYFPSSLPPTNQNPIISV